MTLLDNVNRIFKIEINNGQISIIESPGSIPSVNVIRDDNNITLWRLYISNGELAISGDGISETINILRDITNSESTWQFRVNNEQLYILEKTLDGFGRIVFCKTGLVTNAYYLNSKIDKIYELECNTKDTLIYSITSIIINKIFVNNNITSIFNITSLLPEECNT